MGPATTVGGRSDFKYLQPNIHMTAKVKYNLSRKVTTQVDQGKNVVSMSSEVMPPTDPLIVKLQASNTDLQEKIANVLVSRAAVYHAMTELDLSAATQRTDYGNLGALVQTNSDGSAIYITSCGFGVRSNGTPTPPVEDAPGDLRTRVNGVPGMINFSWGGVNYARNYEVQTTTDLSGATGWASQTEMPSKTKLPILALESGTKYALRARAWGNGMPGPWSTPVQQMAP